MASTNGAWRLQHLLEPALRLLTAARVHARQEHGVEAQDTRRGRREVPQRAGQVAGLRRLLHLPQSCHGDLRHGARRLEDRLGADAPRAQEHAQGRQERLQEAVAGHFDHAHRGDDAQNLLSHSLKRHKGMHARGQRHVHHGSKAVRLPKHLRKLHHHLRAKMLLKPKHLCASPAHQEAKTDGLRLDFRRRNRWRAHFRNNFGAFSHPSGASRHMLRKHEAAAPHTSAAFWKLEASETRRRMLQQFDQCG